MRAHFFDLDILLTTKSQPWIISKDNPSVPIMKIPPSDFNLFRSGIFKKQNNRIDFNGKTFWLSTDFWEKLKVKAKSNKLDISRLAISLQEYLNKDLIDNIPFELSLDVFRTIVNTNDDIYIICSKNTKRNYETQVQKFEEKLKEKGLQIKNYYYISETFINRNDDEIAFKKARLVLQHMVGFKTNDDRFTGDPIPKYHEIYYYDSDPKTIQLMKDINDVLHSLTEKADDSVKEMIKDVIKKDTCRLFTNFWTGNQVNKFLTSQVDLKWSNITKTFEGFKKKALLTESNEFCKLKGLAIMASQTTIDKSIIEDIGHIFQELVDDYTELDFQIYPTVQGFNVDTKNLNDGFRAGYYNRRYSNQKEVYTNVRKILTKLKSSALTDEIHDRLYDLGYECQGPQIFRDGGLWKIQFICKKLYKGLNESWDEITPIFQDIIDDFPELDFSLSKYKDLSKGVNKALLQSKRFEYHGRQPKNHTTFKFERDITRKLKPYFDEISARMKEIGYKSEYFVRRFRNDDKVSGPYRFVITSDLDKSEIVGIGKSVLEGKKIENDDLTHIFQDLMDDFPELEFSILKADNSPLPGWYGDIYCQSKVLGDIRIEDEYLQKLTPYADEISNRLSEYGYKPFKTQHGDNVILQRLSKVPWQYKFSLCFDRVKTNESAKRYQKDYIKYKHLDKDEMQTYLQDIIDDFDELEFEPLIKYGPGVNDANDPEQNWGFELKSQWMDISTLPKWVTSNKIIRGFNNSMLGSLAGKHQIKKTRSRYEQALKPYLDELNNRLEDYGMKALLSIPDYEYQEQDTGFRASIMIAIIIISG